MLFLLSFLKFSTKILIKAIRLWLVNALEEGMNSNEEELLHEAREILDGQPHKSEEDLICECCSITLRDIKEFTKGNKELLDLNVLLNELKLGSGCSSCVKNFESWKSKI